MGMRGRVGIALVAVVVTGSTALVPSAGADAPRARHAGRPQPGGSLVFALEAETDTVNGYCLPSAQLAASGIQVVNAVYDTLTTLNRKGEYVPYLAESVEPNDDYTQWTITVREGVQFHDGTPLDAEAVKLNLDTWRGLNPRISAPLQSFNFQDVADVQVTGPRTVVVTTSRPWLAFPAFLFGSGRQGIAAPAQLADQATCATNLLGTGPFRFVTWNPGESLEVVRNDSYWQEGLPYLQEITFVPLPESQQRVTGLAGGELDMIQVSSALSLLQLEKREKAGEIELTISDRGAEVAYGLLNVSKPPFDDINARRAVAYAGSAKELNNIRNRGLFTIATGPFSPGSPGYVEFDSYITQDVKKARKFAAQYEADHGEPIAYEYLSVGDPESIALAELVKEQQAQAGIEVAITTVAQDVLISRAIAGDFQQAGFRNHPGGDPDTQYVWWHSNSIVNFGRIDDPVIDDLLERGRSETDPDVRVEIYQDLTRRFAKRLYNLWVWYTLWGNASLPDVHGIEGEPLPDGHGRPNSLFAGVVPVAGIWRAD
jgi:peptide/nickel transport system substrate-binding protein